MLYHYNFMPFRISILVETPVLRRVFRINTITVPLFLTVITYLPMAFMLLRSRNSSRILRFIHRHSAITPSLNRTSSQPQRIHPPIRVRCILIQVQPAAQPYRILGGEAPHFRLVVAEQIIVQPALVILVLPCIAQRLFINCAPALHDARRRLPLQFAKGVVIARPAQLPPGVRHLQRRAVLVAMQPEDIRLPAVPRLLDGRQRRPRAVRLIAPAAVRAVVSQLPAS